MVLLLTLAALLQVEKKPDLEKTRLYVYDAEKGMTLRVRDDGKVELTLREDKVDKTYSADSAEEFEKKHPEAAKKAGVRRYLQPREGPGQNDFEKWWAELRRNRKVLPELPELNLPFDENLEKRFQEQKKVYEEFFREALKRFGEPEPPPAPAPLPAPAGREFGVKIDGVGETLRDQLSLKEGEGVLVAEVKPGSVAEKSGLRQHDIIVRLDGKAVGDKWEFRKDLLKALDKAEFEVEILRGGKKETLKAKTPGKKED